MPQLLLSYSQVLLTPHMAFATHEALEEIARVVEGNILAWWRWKQSGEGEGTAFENEVVAKKK